MVIIGGPVRPVIKMDFDWNADGRHILSVVHPLLNACVKIQAQHLVHCTLLVVIGWPINGHLEIQSPIPIRPMDSTKLASFSLFLNNLSYCQSLFHYFDFF